jgi:tripartite-type tricarboxylate transporter receptor subunit TctC
MARIVRLMVLGLMGLIHAGPLMAQAFPTKPVRVILGFPAGTVVDVVMRALSVPMQKQLGQPIVIETRPGAGGSIAVNAVVKAAPDGYTIHFGLLTALIPALTKSNAVDARSDLAPVSEVLATPLAFFVSAKLPVKTMPELIAYAKARPPNALNYATSNAQGEMLMQLVKDQTGITFTLINYPGAPAAVPPMINGDVAMTTSSLAPYMPHLDAGTVRALFVMAPKRLSQFPDLPTAGEAGIPGLEAGAPNLGLWAPRGTPKEIVDKLSGAAIAGVNTPVVTDLLLKQGNYPVGSTPEEQLRRYDAAVKFWTDTARRTNYQAQ